MSHMHECHQEGSYLCVPDPGTLVLIWGAVSHNSRSSVSYIVGVRQVIYTFLSMSRGCVCVLLHMLSQGHLVHAGHHYSDIPRPPVYDRSTLQLQPPPKPPLQPPPGTPCSIFQLERPPPFMERLPVSTICVSSKIIFLFAQ